MSINYYTDTREDTIDAEELALYEAIMAYRASLGLPSIPLSKSLTITASRHALDTVYNIGQYDGHTWSDAPYDSGDRATWPNMWDAPQRLGTAYPGNGYEISVGWLGPALTAPDMTAAVALAGWQGSPGHNDVIVNAGIWDDPWLAIGVAIHESIAHVWFGHQADPAGEPEFEPGLVPDPQDPAGTPTLPGTNGPDRTTGTDADERILGAKGRDTLRGADGDDTLLGGGGRDRLFGERGEDVLRGGAGKDLLLGGKGDDILTGGAGKDVFRFGKRDGDDRVTDLRASDLLDLRALDMSRGQVKKKLDKVDGDWVFDARGTSITFDDASRGDILDALMV